MKTIKNYLDEYGDMTFIEKEYNEVDSVIFAILSYVQFDGLLSHSDKYKIRLADAADNYFKINTEEDFKLLGTETGKAVKMLDIIRKKDRYKDLLLYNYIYLSDEDKQFSALHIDINDKLTYISIEGTDDLISAWKEDFQISYMYPVASQKDSIDYLNRTIKTLSKRKYIIAGHSKGGNLALVGAMNLNRLKRNKVIKVLSYDGPGLRKDEIKSTKYKNILPKYELYLTTYSVVGLLMNYSDNYTIFDTKQKGIMAHDAFTWIVDDDHFVRKDKLSSYSIEIDKIMKTWLNNYNYEQREKFVKEIFKIFERCNIESLKEIRKDKKTFLLILKEASKLSKRSRNMFMELINLMFKITMDDITKYVNDKVVKSME